MYNNHPVCKKAAVSTVCADSALVAFECVLPRCGSQRQNTINVCMGFEGFWAFWKYQILRRRGRDRIWTRTR